MTAKKRAIRKPLAAMAGSLLAITGWLVLWGAYPVASKPRAEGVYPIAVKPSKKKLIFSESFRKLNTLLWRPEIEPLQTPACTRNKGSWCSTRKAA